jgi:hypothetical protein
MRHSEPDAELESLVRHALPFLFADHGNQVVSSEQLPGIGNGQIFIRVRDMTLRVIQKEGSITVLIAPCHRPTSWQTIELILMAADPNAKFPPRPVFGSLTELSSLLESRLAQLSSALSPERFAVTIQNSQQAGRKGHIILESRAPSHVPAGRRLLAEMVSGIARIIRLLIPQSRDAYARTMPVGSDAELEESVRRELGFLFKQHGAKISSNGRLRIMDFAYVTIDVGNLRLRAARDRGSIEISIAPVHAVRYWQSLGEALLAVHQEGELPKAVPSSILRGAGARLEPVLARLDEAFSEAQYPATRERIREIRESFEEAWVNDWNRRPNRYHATRS